MLHNFFKYTKLFEFYIFTDKKLNYRKCKLQQ